MLLRIVTVSCGVRLSVSAIGLTSSLRCFAHDVEWWVHTRPDAKRLRPLAHEDLQARRSPPPRARVPRGPACSPNPRRPDRRPSTPAPRRSGSSGRCSKGSSSFIPIAVQLTIRSKPPVRLDGAARSEPARRPRSPLPCRRDRATSSFRRARRSGSRPTPMRPGRPAPRPPREPSRRLRGPGRPSPRSARAARRAVRVASVLSARMRSPRKVRVLAAPICRAASEASSATRSAASLCGIVTLAPTYPSPARARTRSSNSAGSRSIAP